MKKYLYILILLFLEMILEIGFQLKTLIVTGLSIKNLFLYGLLSIILFKSAFGGRAVQDRYVQKTFILFIILILYAVFSLSFHIIFGQDRYDVIQGALSIKAELIDAFIALLVFFYFIRSLDDAIFMTRALVVLIGIAALMTVVDAVSGSINFFGYDDFNQRTNGAMGEPNQTGAILAFYLPVTMALCLQKARFRLLFVGIAFMMTAALLATGSRGGMLSAASGLLASLYFMRNDLSISRKVLFVSGSVVGLLLVWFFIPEYYRESLISRFSFFGESDVDWREASAGRTLLWTSAYELWIQSPLIGQGWHAFKILMNMASHNTYVEYAVSLGIVGLAIYLFLWLRVFRYFSGYKRIQPPMDMRIMMNGYQGSVLAICLAVFFVNLYKPWFMVWPLIGVAMACAYYLKTAGIGNGGSGNALRRQVESHSEKTGGVKLRQGGGHGY